MDQTAASILKVEKLNLFYGAFQAVKNVSFDVKAGEIFGLLGPNGAGKTSTLSAVEGLLQPQSGEITVTGHNIIDEPLLAKANIGVQLQSTSCKPHLPVPQILRLYAGLHAVVFPRDRSTS